MRKDVYLFRHGQTDANKEHRWQGCGINLSLNEEGRVQAFSVLEKLRNAGLECIFSSPLKRAWETAEIVAEALNLPVKVREEFREGCFGEAEGITTAELDELWPDISSRWKNPEELDVGYPGGETKRQIQERMFAALNTLLDEDYDVFGVATHGSALRNLLHLFGVDLARIANGTIFHLVYENGGWRAEAFD